MGATTVRPLRSPGVEQQQGRPVDYIVTVPASNKKVTVKAPKESKIFAMTPKAMVEVSLPQGAAGDVLFTEGSAIVKRLGQRMSVDENEWRPLVESLNEETEHISTRVASLLDLIWSRMNAA